MLLLDADIEFGELETIERTLCALREDKKAQVVVDRPLKDAVRRKKKSLLERISLRQSRSEESSGAPRLAGSFYLARAAMLRQIWLPKGLPSEDGFIRSMIVTNCFRAAPDEERIARAEGASHYFETLVSPRRILAHELRVTIGTAINCYLAWDLLLFATDPEGPGAGITIRNWTRQDERWVQKVVSNAVANRGWWVLPRGMLLRRFAPVRRPGGFKLRRAALCALTFAIDLPILLTANRVLKKNKGLGFW